jgi:hypothetical protein
MNRTIIMAALLALALPEPALAAGKPLSIKVASVAVVEGGKVCSLVTMSGGNGRAVTVSWATQNGSAAAGVDYAAASGSSSLTKAGLSICAQTIDDKLPTGARQFRFNATVTSGSVHPSAYGLVTVNDNDAAPAEIAIGATVHAVSVCQSLTNGESIAPGIDYKIVGFAFAAEEGTAPQSNARDFVLLNDTTHLGDGWFALTVPMGCVA